MTPHASPRGGFTLVELSIVLVVIGLVVGGVLVGRDLIHAAEIRTQVGQIEQINTAALTFRLKYNCLPGDCASATQFFAAAAQPERVTNGPGTGQIDGYGYGYGPAVHMDAGWGYYYGSWIHVFDHLAAAALWPTAQYDETAVASNLPGIAYPRLKLVSGGVGPVFVGGWNNAQGGVVVGWEPGYSYVPGGHKIRLGACPAFPGIWGPDVLGFTCGLNPSDAAAVDGKIDDGRPFSGRAVISMQWYIYRIPGGANNQLYAYCDTDGASDADRIRNAQYRSEANMQSWGGSVVSRYCALSITAAF